ncbi:MAG TPA: RNA polymerase sigma factor [Vicinamibacterales bacterium]|jgi:RNA polymerase sigma-70 factor (ECF subfamily)|nr:RNA polymerase sigma factor [Vicinamibacterales bacterium]
MPQSSTQKVPLSDFEALMRRYNSRLFRVARAILRDDGEAEDAVQDAYLQVYRKLHEFRGDSQISTWLTRVVVNASLMRVRKQKRGVVVPLHKAATADTPEASLDVEDRRAPSPPETTFRAEVRRILERRIDELPLAFRTVFVMRDVQDMSVQETADALGIAEATVRTRLFRARGMLREALQREIDDASIDVFSFAGDRCDRIVASVIRIVSSVK